MIRRRAGVALLALALAVALSPGVSGTTGATVAPDSDSATEESFVVRQGDACFEASPLGDGSVPVESFYNYSADANYSSVGMPHLQANQVSNLFVYHGPAGYSLVFLHDRYGDGPYGGTISFTVTGLPDDGSWVVEDDDYEGRDDVFDHDGTRTEIHWMWASNRTDGAVFRGLTAEEDAAITVEPGFNERADAWGEWPYSGDDANRTESWRLLDGDGTAVTELDVAESVTVATGTCD